MVTVTYTNLPISFKKNYYAVDKAAWLQAFKVNMWRHTHTHTHTLAL